MLSYDKPANHIDDVYADYAILVMFTSTPFCFNRAICCVISHRAYHSHVTDLHQCGGGYSLSGDKVRSSIS